MQPDGGRLPPAAGCWSRFPSEEDSHDDAANRYLVGIAPVPSTPLRPAGMRALMVLGFLRRVGETAGQITDHRLRVESLRQVAVTLNAAGDRNLLRSCSRKPKQVLSACPGTLAILVPGGSRCCLVRTRSKRRCGTSLWVAWQAVPQAGEGLHTPEAYVASAYVEVGRQQALSGFPVAAAAVLQTALEKSRELDDYPRWNVMAEIAATRAEWGDFEQAEKLVSLLGHDMAEMWCWKQLRPPRQDEGSFRAHWPLSVGWPGVVRPAPASPR